MGPVLHTILKFKILMIIFFLLEVNFDYGHLFILIQ